MVDVHALAADVSVLRRSRKRFAAIDFGTGFCSLAYTLHQDDEIVNVTLSTDGSPRVPTAILLKRQPDSTLKVVKFGKQAQEKISKMKNELLNEHLYFESFKMRLLNEAGVSRDMRIQSLDGSDYYLVEVIAFVLCHLKYFFMNHLTKSGCPILSSADFDWVITVPAIWRARGKQMMREAAYLAGLLSGGPEINRLTRCGSSIKSPVEKDPHKLTLALEPECAALYCQQLDNDDIALYCKHSGSLITDGYMVCDFGAGTIDITAYIKHGDDDIEVIIPPTGNDSGGKEVNQLFHDLLEQIVNDPGLESFLNKRGKKSTHKAIVNTIVFRDFEGQKLQFGMEPFVESDQQSDKESMVVSIDPKLVEFYSKKKIIQGVRKLQDHRIVFNEEMNTLEIEYTKAKELFDSVMNRAIDCVKNALTSNGINEKIGIIFLVGGFGGCCYTYGALREAIPRGIHIVVPKLHTLAVSRGAILYRRNPEIVKARRMEASYGISYSVLFKERIHNEAYAYRDPDTGVKKCKNVFSALVRKGQKVTLIDPVVKIVIPHSQASERAYIPFYTTTDPSLLYTEDKRGRDIAPKIGSLTLDCPNPNNLQKNERELEITMDFSSTEIKVQARALYLPGQPSVKAVLDFLE